MTKATPFASARREVVKPQRLVVALPAADLARIDNWGIAAGKISRSETVRELLNKGLADHEKQIGSD
jgi:metal-responsive CopG/Arc/MetJ family transcriptional regulator